MIVHYNFYLIGTFVLLLAGGLLFALRKFSPHPLREDQQQVLIGPLSFFFAVYAFFLGFSLVILWQGFNTMQDSVSREANSLIVSHRLCQGMEGSGEFRKALEAYTESVYTREWATMDEGRMSKETERLHDAIWQTAGGLRPAGVAEAQAYKEILESLKDFNEQRIHRTLSASGSLIAPMWLVLIIGGVCSVVCLYLLSLPHDRIQTLVDLILLGIIIFSLLLTGELNRPFHGNIMITSKPFEVVLVKMKALKGEAAPRTVPGQNVLPEQ